MFTRAENMDISDSLRSTQCLSVDCWGGMGLAAAVPPDSQGLVVEEKLLISAGLPPSAPVLSHFPINHVYKGNLVASSLGGWGSVKKRVSVNS